MAIDRILGKNYPNFEEHGTPPCAESDPEAFFPERAGGDGAKDYIKMALAVCTDCPYKKACFDYAMKNSEIGVWGGTTEIQRRRIRMANRDKYPKKR